MIMPALGVAQDTGRVVRWLYGEGDAVTKHQPLIEIETDKVTVELEAPADGTLAAVTASRATTLPGTAIALILSPGGHSPHGRAAPGRAPARPLRGGWRATWASISPRSHGARGARSRRAT